MTSSRLGKFAGRAWWAALILSAGGCATFWDDCTSRNFRMKDLWTKEDPLIVLRDSADGNKRAKALALLVEPAPNAGHNEEQELYLKILTKSALEDRDPLCRLSAVRALGTYKDPRCPRARGCLPATLALYLRTQLRHSPTSADLVGPDGQPRRPGSAHSRRA